MKVFETWTHNGIRYIAIPKDQGSHAIMSETGDNFGSWQRIEEFKRRQAKGYKDMSLGLAELRIYAK